MAETNQLPEQTNNRNLPEWNLILSDGQPYTLDGSISRSPSGQLIARRPADFRWTRVFHALTILLVQLKAWQQKRKPGGFVMEGKKHSPTAALAGALPKDKKGVIARLTRLFGECANTRSTVWNYIQVCERDKRWQEKRTWIVTVRGLSAANVHIYLGELAYEQGRDLTSLKELDAVTEDLCRNWDRKQNRSSPVSHEKNRSLRVWPDEYRAWDSWHAINVGQTWRMFTTGHYSLPC
jgi:hypothetical protein